MSVNTVQNVIDYAETFIEYQPLAVGTGNNPALGIANSIQYTVMGPPFCWAWNRAENTDLVTVPGTQDYTVNVLDFGYLEKVSLTSQTDNSVYEIKDVYNNLARGVADPNINKQQRPQACCVLLINYGVSVKLRFMGVPVDNFRVTLTYQKLVAPLTALTSTGSTWSIPDQYWDIYANMFTAEAMAIADDNRSTQYHQRGLAALIGKSEGLSELQINAFLEQYWARVGQQQYRAGIVNQSIQARGAQ